MLTDLDRLVASAGLLPPLLTELTELTGAPALTEDKPP